MGLLRTPFQGGCFQRIAQQAEHPRNAVAALRAALAGGMDFGGARGTRADGGFDVRMGQRIARTDDHEGSAPGEVKGVFILHIAIAMRSQ